MSFGNSSSDSVERSVKRPFTPQLRFKQRYPGNASFNRLDHFRKHWLQGLPQQRHMGKEAPLLKLEALFLKSAVKPSLHSRKLRRPRGACPDKAAVRGAESAELIDNKRQWPEGKAVKRLAYSIRLMLCYIPEELQRYMQVLTRDRPGTDCGLSQRIAELYERINLVFIDNTCDKCSHFFPSFTHNG